MRMTIRERSFRVALLITGGEAGVDFPLHGVVALVSQDEGATWRELWRLEN